MALGIGGACAIHDNLVSLRLAPPHNGFDSDRYSGDMMALRVLYMGMLWDYGDPARGTSFEENSFHAGLRAHPDVEVTHFDYVDQFRRLGYEEMNRRLVEAARQGQFDALFCVTFHEEVMPTTLAAISEMGTTTIGWGCDDHWRFEDFSVKYAPAFDFWVTTACSALPKFEALGMADRVIKSQWAVEPTVYHPTGVPRDIDVSFVGQPHGQRRQVIQGLHDSGIRVAVFGYGWAGLDSRVTHEQMIEVFSRSRVSLNLSNSSVTQEQQIKGRVFEVPGCRGFLLTENADNLESYYCDGTEIVVFQSPEDLEEKIRYYLAHDDEREAIARAGYDRTLCEHTWQRRFDEVFREAGVSD